MTAYTRRHEAAERVAMRHWLREHGADPVMGQEPHHTQRLMIQVQRLGGDPHKLMREGCERVERQKKAEALRVS